MLESESTYRQDMGEDEPDENEGGHASEQQSLTTNGRVSIHCLTIIGQIEGHYEAASQTKTTKYEHVIPQLVAVQEDPSIQALLVILNTVGGDVEAGLALAELISGISKPTASLVLGGGHSIGIPMAVCAERSFIVPTATMTVHPVRHNGTVLGVPQTMRYFDDMQARVSNFVQGHSNMSGKRFEELMLHTGQLVMDMGTVLTGEQAVEEGLIDEVGSLTAALGYLYERLGVPHSEGEEEKPQRKTAKKPPRKTAAKTKRMPS